MTEEGIKEVIIKRVENSTVVNYAIWRIGITKDPNIEKEFLGNPEYWNHWKADSHQIAINAANYFLNQFPTDIKERMTGNININMLGEEDVFVYIH